MNCSILFVYTRGEPIWEAHEPILQYVPEIVAFQRSHFAHVS